jgi:hypothetical protein
MTGNGPAGPGSENPGSEDPRTDEHTLLRDLGSALGPDPLPAGLLDRAEQLILLRDLDADLAEQLDDVAAEPAGARGAVTGSAGQLWFAVADGSVTVEIRPGRRGTGGTLSLEGVLHGDLADTVDLLNTTGLVSSTSPDPMGRFTIDAAPDGPLSLRLHFGTRVVRTGWFVL